MASELDAAPLPGSKRIFSDRVAAHAAREDGIERARIEDGSLHPYFGSALMKKVPASDWERSWLFDYFKAMPAELSGNYFR